MPTLITEAGTLAPTKTGRLEITLITPGWGSSGYYSAEMLEQAAADRVFPRGTQQHIDHMGASERIENSAGSLRTLAAVLTEDAEWEPDWTDPKTGVKGRLKSEALLGSQYRETITEFAEYIGTSISAGADVTIGEAEGRKGHIVEKLHPNPLNRVDFVTVAGRGGRISDVLEAAVHRIAEATANDTRDALSAAVKEAYGADGVWLWVLDYDEANVWFTQESEDESHTWQQAYTMTDTTATLSGDLIEVRRVTTYTPITPPADDAAQESKNSPPIPAGVTERKESAMTTTQIEEAELATLKQDAGRVTALEADNADLRKSVAEAVIAEAFAGLEAPRTKARIFESFTAKGSPMTTDALRTEATESAAELKVLQGAGKVDGVGDTTPVGESKTITDDDIVNAL
ncbi:hypothetical protein [Arthrobacter burdickii]|uniref:Capsid maturation protease n=1 Tax=Arthrobacter burdickii TaxID=3035920 RepID=A0ABT8K3E0_9MICC|nr:hypothetical protein [Arthrobacter burdickii]MDN4611945.1 hypothetical protein [Arthrobacter burdickii]